jgi:ABC-type antimicrobial peptide transport system permease subunit
MIAPGLVVGLAAALAVARVARGLLVGVSAADPGVLLGAVGLVCAVAGVAISLPARRAGRVDPLAALRQE